VRDEAGLVGHRTVGQSERPFTEPVVGAADADGWHLEPLLDLGLQGDRVLGDVRTEHGEAPFVDELAVGVDHRLHRAAGQPFHLSRHELDRTVEHALLEPVVEDELERQEHVLADVALRRRRNHHVRQDAELDRRCVPPDCHVDPPVRWLERY
jgi:hypothetical protein